MKSNEYLLNNQFKLIFKELNIVNLPLSYFRWEKSHYLTYQLELIVDEDIKHNTWLESIDKLYDTITHFIKNNENVGCIYFKDVGLNYDSGFYLKMINLLPDEMFFHQIHLLNSFILIKKDYSTYNKEKALESIKKGEFEFFNESIEFHNKEIQQGITLKINNMNY